MRQWFDIVLPPNTILSDAKRFEVRYGLRYVRHHLVFFLDEELQQELSFPCNEISLPLETLARLAAQNATALVVENKVSRLTLPPRPRAIGLGALGEAVIEFRDCSWLFRSRVIYWGIQTSKGWRHSRRFELLFRRPKTS